MFGLSAVGLAYDSDIEYASEREYSADRQWHGGREDNHVRGPYFVPTQRYYGKGYTVAYRFVPWSDRMRALNSTSTWDSDQMRLPANAAASTSASGQSPRVTYFHQKPSASTGGFQSRNSDIATTPKPLPPIGEAPAKK